MKAVQDGAALAHELLVDYDQPTAASAFLIRAGTIPKSDRGMALIAAGIYALAAARYLLRSLDLTGHDVAAELGRMREHVVTTELASAEQAWQIIEEMRRMR